MMIYLIQYSSLGLLIYGFHKILQGLLRVPGNRVFRVANRLIRINQGAGIPELFIQGIADFISRKIKLGEAGKTKLTTMLRYFDEPISAEVFVARRITGSLLPLPAAFVFSFVFPILSVVLVFIAAIYYFNAELELEKKFNKKRREIEYELPRFCATVLQEIKTGKDVIGMIERYTSGAGKSLKRELEITLADMKSSNQEAALIRLESRLSIGSVSDIVRGLIGVIRGDEVRAYFEMLSHDLDAMELQRLETEAAKQPDKIKKYQFLVLVSMILLYVITIGVYLLSLDKPAVL